MAGRRFDVADVVEVLQHWQAGGSERQLARSLGIGRNRVARIVAAAQAAGLTLGGPVMTRPEWEARVPDDEQLALLPLPRDPFEVAHWATATVHPDYHVQVQRHFYSVPWRLVGTLGTTASPLALTKTDGPI